MTLLEIYKSRKDNLVLRIKESKSLYETGSVISEVFETMQYQYLSQGDNDQLTDKLEQLMALARAAFPILESVNKYRMWENARDDAKPKKKSPLPGLVLYLIGMLLIFVTVGYYMFLNNITFADAKTWLAVMAVGCLFMFVAGFMLFFRKKSKNKTVVEISVDADDIVKRLEGVVTAIDAALESEKKAKEQQAVMLESAINADEVQLFSYLMEAKLSGEADFALEQLDEVEHYLARQDVILVNYTKGNEKYFEFLEGEITKTIRPAFVRRGEIMQKGLAQLKTE